MIMDIVILSIFAITIFLSMRNGFTMTIINFFSGFASIILAFIFCDDLAKYIYDNTSIYQMVEKKVAQHLSYNWETSASYENLPDLFKIDGGSLTENLILDGTSKLTSIFMVIISFILIVLSIKILAFLFKSLLSKKSRGGFIGFADGLLGLILGMILGIFNVLLFLALLVPVTGFIAPELGSTIIKYFEGSFVAEDLYNNNILLIIFRDFLMK